MTDFNTFHFIRLYNELKPRPVETFVDGVIKYNEYSAPKQTVKQTALSFFEKEEPEPYTTDCKTFKYNSQCIDCEYAVLRSIPANGDDEVEPKGVKHKVSFCCMNPGKPVESALKKRASVSRAPREDVETSEVHSTPDKCVFTHMVLGVCRKCPAASKHVYDYGIGDYWYCTRNTRLMPVEEQYVEVEEDGDCGQIRLLKADYIAFVRRAAKAYVGYKRFIVYALRDAVGLPVNLPSGRIPDIAHKQAVDKHLESARKKNTIQINMNLTPEEREYLTKQCNGEGVNKYIKGCLEIYCTSTPTNTHMSCNKSKISSSVDKSKNGVVT